MVLIVRMCGPVAAHERTVVLIETVTRESWSIKGQGECDIDLREEEDEDEGLERGSQPQYAVI